MRLNQSWSDFFGDSQSREFASKAEEISSVLDESLKKAGVSGSVRVSRMAAGSIVADLIIVLLDKSRNVNAQELASLLGNSSVGPDPTFQLRVAGK